MNETNELCSNIFDAKPGLIILETIDDLWLKYLLFHELSTVSLQSSMEKAFFHFYPRVEDCRLTVETRKLVK